jgi:hypothetical protein
VEEMKETKTCIINNIKELGIYEEQVQCLTTTTTRMAHSIADQENAFQQCKQAHLALIRFHMSIIRNKIATYIDLSQN